MSADIRNDFPHGDIRRPVVEQVTIFKPESERNWTFSHHPHLTFFQGKLYAIWSNGRNSEDDAGQRVMIASSSDFRTWTVPEPLLDSRMAAYGEWVYTAAGFYVHGDRLVAYIGQFEYEPQALEDGKRKSTADAGHRHTGLLAMTTADGSRWSEPIDLGMAIVPNHGPQRTKSGRLILSGNISFPYTDDPSGLSGWTLSGICPSEPGSELVDDSESIHLLYGKMGWPTMLCEGSFFQTDDGKLRMMLRSTERRLWTSTSEDDGESWSDPKPASFPDSNAKFHFGRLPDGRFYYVGNPVPDGKRNPLVVSVSEDGERFHRHSILCDVPRTRRFEGMHKGGEYGYPHSLVHDGYLHVIFSVTKEEVHIARVPVSAL